MEVEIDVSGLHHHHQQELSSQTLESMLVCTKAAQDKKPRPPEEALKCPRCDSSNTKFCYYNNYSLTQPRYFCKSCRRYWTKGGTLRNVPVGGGCRKNKRSSSSSSATSSNSSSCSALSKRPQDHHLIQQHHHQQQHQLNLINSNSNNHLISGLPHLPYDSTCTDLSLAFARLQNQANGPIGFDQFDHHDHLDHHDHHDHQLGSTSNGDQMGFLGFLENGNVLFHNGLYNGGNLGNGDMGSVGNLMGLNNVMNMNSNPNPSPNPNPNPNNNHNHNPMFSEHQDQEMMTCGAATTAVTMTTVKQEATGGGVLWGFPWQMGAGGGGGGDQGMNMVHEVESGRSMIGGWNGIGSTNWHGLINSPLM